MTCIAPPVATTPMPDWAGPPFAVSWRLDRARALTETSRERPLTDAEAEELADVLTRTRARRRILPGRIAASEAKTLALRAELAVLEEFDR